MRVIDLTDAPSTRQMLLRAEYVIASACHGEESLLKFVTKTPSLTEKLRACLRGWARKKKILFMIYGEKFSEMDEVTQYLLDQFPKEASDPDLGQKNPFVTIVCFFISR